MSRVINTNNPNKQRNKNRRLIAELLRRMSGKPTIDDEARDMAAAVVLALKEIDDGLNVTMAAWEKRGYWMKAEKFHQEWSWTNEAAANLDDVIRHEAWDLLPNLLLDLFPRFADVQIAKYTRKEDAWEGMYAALMEMEPLELPY
jgi:hypothetical protein